MDTYQHILLTVDYSGDCELVALKARELARRSRAMLSVLHVVDDIPMPDTQYGTIIPLDAESNDPLLEREKNRFSRLAEDLGIDRTRRWLVWGVPKQEIVSFAEREKVDLIVVGSHERRGLSFLFGSIAEAVIHFAKCDVMAVRLPDG
ncbi:MAG: universal stress protein [Gammaproteobacteria bacterium]